MDYNEDILNEAEEGDEWSEDEPTGGEETETPAEELEDDWASDEEDV